GQGPLSTAAAGGGIYQGGGLVSLDAFTLAHLLTNTDSKNDAFNNLFGQPVVLQPSDSPTPSSNFQAATVADLINDINAANKRGGSNTIVLTADNYVLPGVDNSADGPTGLPVITAGDHLTITSNGAVVMRSTASGVPAFRLFDVAQGAELT